MTATLPVLIWQEVAIVDSADTGTRYHWVNNMLQQGAAPSGLTLSASTQRLQAQVLTIGTNSTLLPFTITASAGTKDFLLSSAGAIAVGMLVSGPAGVVPNGLQIMSHNSSTGTFEFGGDTSAQPGAAWTTPAAITSASQFYAIDSWPYGTLAAIVSPGAGVTLSDWGFDGTGNDSNVGNGTAACNNAGQANGLFGVKFTNTGTYSVSAAFTSNDLNYNNATISPALTVTVTS